MVCEKRGKETVLERTGKIDNICASIVESVNSNCRIVISIKHAIVLAQDFAKRLNVCLYKYIRTYMHILNIKHNEKGFRLLNVLYKLVVTRGEYCIKFHE